MFFCIKPLDLLLKTRWSKRKDMMSKDVTTLNYTCTYNIKTTLPGTLR